MPRRLNPLLKSLSTLLAAALLLPGCSGPTPTELASASGRPRLVLLLAVDQLRPDRISPALPGGLGRLQREGRVFEAAAHAHAFTDTCPGHAVMLTGRNPAALGVPANSYTDPETLERRYCVEDRAPGGALVGRAGSPADGRSPRNLRSDTLGDWMKAAHPETRVFSVAGKDRSAIAMGGRRPDGAYWLARGASPLFLTSRYYVDSLPDWVATWGPDKLFAGLPQDWSYLPDSIAAAQQGARPDDYPHESPLLGRSAPHPLLRQPADFEGVSAEWRAPADRLYATPFADEVTLAFARELVVQEGLGEGDHPDLLAVSLAATDLVGHLYGPESWESRDALARLDAMVGEFLAFLSERVGADRLVVVLTADHGVLTLPEWLQETGRSRCPVAGGRVDPAAMLPGLFALLDARFGSSRDGHGLWFVLSGSRLTLNRARVEAGGVRAEDIVELARKYLAGQPGITRVWTRDEVLAGGGPEPMARFYRNSWDPERAGDLAMQVAEDCLLESHRTGTSHGSPYAYDRAVPLVFLGPGIAAGRVATPAAPVDIAPTLARLLGIEPPDGLDGRALPLR
jgi:hypothetical protein